MKTTMCGTVFVLALASGIAHAQAPTMSKDEAQRICVGSAAFLISMFEDSKKEGVPLLQTSLGRKLAENNDWFLALGQAEMLNKYGQTPLALSNQLLSNCMDSYAKYKLPALELR